MSFIQHKLRRVDVVETGDHQVRFTFYGENGQMLSDTTVDPLTAYDFGQKLIDCANRAYHSTHPESPVK